MCIIIYNMGGESQKKWLGVGKLQKFKCNSQVQKNLLGLFLPFSQFLYRYYKMFSRSLFSQNRAQEDSGRTDGDNRHIFRSVFDDGRIVRLQRKEKV